MFKIGQSVVCKNTSSIGSTFPLGIKKGEIYIVDGFEECPICKCKLLLLRGIDSGSLKTCGHCSYYPLPTNAFMSIRFEPVKYSSVSSKEIIINVIEERLDVPLKESITQS